MQKLLVFGNIVYLVNSVYNEIDCVIPLNTIKLFADRNVQNVRRPFLQHS